MAATCENSKKARRDAPQAKKQDIGSTLKAARENMNLSPNTAAAKTHTTQRTVKRYENGEIKRADPTYLLEAIKEYNDINIGLAYLAEDEIFRYIFGEISITDPVRTAAEYAALYDGDIRRQLLSWALDEGATVIDATRIKRYMYAAINIYLNIRQRYGFAN